MVPYGDNNNDNGPADFDYCRPHTYPDFGLFHSLVSIDYSGCDEEKLTYHSCQHEQEISNTGIMAISNNLSCAFDTTYPCSICGKVSHTFEGCEELQDPVSIRKINIHFCATLQKITGTGANQGQDVNSLQYSKLSHVKSVNLLPPLPHQDTASAHCLEKLEGLLVKPVSAAH